MSNNINFEELVAHGNRGKQPEDINQKCLQLCKDYLGSVWSSVSDSDIVVKRINGGFTNQLYYCALKPEINSTDDDDTPREVAIRLYGKKHFNTEKGDNDYLSDTIIALYASQYKLGPEILGLFEGGQIMKFYEHHQFRRDSQQKPHLVRELASKLARIHSLDIPIKRNENLLFGMFDKFVNDYQSCSMKQLIDNSDDCETLKHYDFKSEIEWIKRLVNNTNSPIVFTHFDFRGNNIMVIDNYSDANANLDNKRIILCDYDFSNYCYRGLDLGTIMLEWDRNLDEFTTTEKKFPEAQCREFLGHYFNELATLSGKQFSEDERNSIESLLKETKVFSLVSLMFGLLFVLNLEEELIGTNTQQMQLAEHWIKMYDNLKIQFSDVIS